MTGEAGVTVNLETHLIMETRPETVSLISLLKNSSDTETVIMSRKHPQRQPAATGLPPSLAACRLSRPPLRSSAFNGTLRRVSSRCSLCLRHTPCDGRHGAPLRHSCLHKAFGWSGRRRRLGRAVSLQRPPPSQLHVELAGYRHITRWGLSRTGLGLRGRSAHRRRSSRDG